MASPTHHLYSGLRWVAVGIWSWSKRFPILHLLLFTAAVVIGVLVVWLVPQEMPDHETAARIGGIIFGVVCLAMLIRAIIAMARGRWREYCDREIERARLFYDPERFR